MKPLLLILVILAVVPEDLQEYQQAKKVAEEIVQETRTVLIKTISEAGLKGAIERCSSVALDIAKKKEKEEWRVRRVSFKYRNPEDVPDDYEKKVLQEFEELKRAGKLTGDYIHAEVVNERGKKFLRFMKPVIIQGELCLKCHGSPGDIPEDVKEKLKELYPDDKATGYKLNELRGAVSIKIPLSNK